MFSNLYTIIKYGGWIVPPCVLTKGEKMINSNAFDYINVLDKAADASWLRNETIANNIANVDTPNYKRQDVNFQSALAEALGYNKYTSMDEKVGNLTTDQAEATVYTDYSGYSYRLDGNNVDIDTENTILAKNQLVYEGLLNSISQEFQNLQAAMKTS